MSCNRGKLFQEVFAFLRKSNSNLTSKFDTNEFVGYILELPYNIVEIIAVTSLKIMFHNSQYKEIQKISK